MVSLEFARLVVAGAVDGDPRALTMLARRALWVMPVVNPDGYEWNKYDGVNHNAASFVVQDASC